MAFRNPTGAYSLPSGTSVSLFGILGFPTASGQLYPSFTVTVQNVGPDWPCYIGQVGRPLGGLEIKPGETVSLRVPATGDTNDWPELKSTSGTDVRVLAVFGE